MLLSASQVSKNYSECYRLTASLLKQKFLRRGFDADPGHPEFIELCQSVIGHENVVLLLQTKNFIPADYQPVLEKAIDEVKRIFFPDICKKRFISLDTLESDSLAYQEEWATDPEPVAFPEEKEMAERLRKILSVESFEYFKNHLLPRLTDLDYSLQYLLQSPRLNADASSSAKIEKKIRLLRQFYPDGNIVFIGTVDGLGDLSDQQIIHIFLNMYLGLERAFPVNFLQRDGINRSALLVRFLIENILNTRPETILEQKDETFFIRHKLQNVYRFFNYSANRVLRNAYPALIPPWLHSRSSARYWEEPQKRIEAIRWLVEQRLKLPVETLYKCPLSKDQFARHGLSYMFNQYYNSVSRALSEAYPHLEPWEIGKVPFEYWNEENTIRALRWMVERKGWQVDELPAKVRSREFNRKTFSEFGLATLFEKKFAKNIYRAISSAYPGRFEPWELGKVPSEYWTSPQNIYNASKWIAEQEGIEEHEIIPAIRRKRLTATVLSKYSIGAALKKICRGSIETIFAPFFWREQRFFLQEHKLLRKISILKNSERKTNLLHFLLYGLFHYDVHENSLQNIRRYDRIAHRIQRRSFTRFD